MARPLFAPRVNATEAALISVCVMEVMVGAEGLVYGVSDNELDAEESPLSFVATIVMVYPVPLIKLLTVMGDVVVPLLVYAPPLSEYL